MNNDNFMVFVYNAIIALFAFFVAAPMLLNAISLFTVQKRFAKVMVDEGVVKEETESLEMFEEMIAAIQEETVRRLHPKKQVAGVLISLLVLAGLGWTCTRVDMGYICGCIALVAGVLKYRNIIQFNSLTVQRFRNTYKDEMDLNKYNKYVDSHF